MRFLSLSVHPNLVFAHSHSVQAVQDITNIIQSFHNNIYIKLKINTKMAGEQMRFQQHLKNVQCFGFTNVSWEYIP